MRTFNQVVEQIQGHRLYARAIRVIQANLGLRCNLRCQHCHVSASPRRNEVMPWPIMASIIKLAKALPGCMVDITGGAPELNPNIRRFISGLRDASIEVQLRTNLTVFDEPGLSDIPEFLANRQIRIMASLPCYLDENVAMQRGAGVYSRSIASLLRLNLLGYGRRSELPLNLVYNPGGPFLPPDQAELEGQYRFELRSRYGIEFTQLLTIANMPLGRFLEDLLNRDKAMDYRQLLHTSFNPKTLERLMCREQICVAWDGSLADCDFNLTLRMGLAPGLPLNVDDVDLANLTSRPIVTGEHCFACTAGCGSSCGGALVA